jgi:hypothetical protein
VELVKEKKTFLPDSIISACSSSTSSAHVSVDEDGLASTSVRIPFCAGSDIGRQTTRFSRQ